ncbi:MAG: aminotransferase class IV [Alphaproteobacteria bacterium]|nr:aminotransferase class IV [Alphaproteobacteria bacterium]
MEQKIWLNEQLVTADEPHIHHYDSGFTTGIGIFDSLLCHEGTPQHGQDHLARIHHDCEIVLRASIPSLNYEKFLDIIQTLLKHNNLETGYARIRTTVTGGKVTHPLAPVEHPNILISAGTTPAPDELPDVTAVIITDYPRIAGCALENCKRLDYSRAYAARMDAINHGVTEAILTNTNGDIACGATSNIFIEEDGTLFTPPLSDGVLAGVTRKNLMLERNIKEESISIARLKNADKIYISNSFFGLKLIQLL